MCIHPVFHVSLLDPFKLSIIPGRIVPPPPPVVVDSEQEFESEEVLDSKNIPQSSILPYQVERIFHLG